MGNGFKILEMYRVKKWSKRIFTAENSHLTFFEKKKEVFKTCLKNKSDVDNIEKWEYFGFCFRKTFQSLSIDEMLLPMSVN